MANISKIKLPDNTTYDVISMQTRSVIFCRPTVASTASAFKVNVPSIPSLYNGLSLYIYNNIATSVANATLELNNFGAKSIKINGGADDVGNYWRYGRAYLFVFDSVTNRWVMNYTDIDTVELTQAQYDALVQAGEVLPNVNYYISNANHSTPIYASGVHYDNSDSGLSANRVQSAIDEVADRPYFESGSSGTIATGLWTWRKYDNGEIDLWGKQDTSESMTFNAWGGIYSYDSSAIPLNANVPTFTQVDFVQGSMFVGGLNGFGTLRTDQSSYIFCRGSIASSGTYSCTKTFYKKGRWK